MAPLLLLVVLSVTLQASAKKEFVDLSQEHKPGIVAYPIHSRSKRESVDVKIEYNTFQTVEHYGTHVDVPCHMMEGKWRLHEVPVSQFTGPAVVIDLTDRAADNPDAGVTVADIEAYHLFPYPGFHANTTKWLVENRSTFHGIGVDTISLDRGLSKTFRAYLNLFAGNKVGFETLANLEKIPEAGAMFHGIPINLYDGSGCPVRTYAIVDSDSSASSRLTPMAFVGMLAVGMQAVRLRFM
ncbi:kynurenine formamidase-like [Liolophura sinensis]|uniref:kynurenine formamidase-like n=1 Tax=Liolophura sinensis TaxID=3198878 RepID=UPI003158765B